MRKMTTALLLAVAVGGCVLPRGEAKYRTVQFVYHSDTRGFYQPCG